MSTWDVQAGRVIYISYISHFAVRVQLADLNWWVVFNLSSCGLDLPLSATQPLSHRILTNKNRKRHIPYAYMNNITWGDERIPGHHKQLFFWPSSHSVNTDVWRNQLPVPGCRSLRTSLCLLLNSIHDSQDKISTFFSSVHFRFCWSGNCDPCQ
jgi:hypothetical protein